VNSSGVMTDFVFPCLGIKNLLRKLTQVFLFLT